MYKACEDGSCIQCIDTAGQGACIPGPNEWWHAAARLRRRSCAVLYNLAERLLLVHCCSIRRHVDSNTLFLQTKVEASAVLLPNKYLNFLICLDLISPCHTAEVIAGSPTDNSVRSAPSYGGVLQERVVLFVSIRGLAPKQQDLRAISLAALVLPQPYLYRKL